MLAQRLDHFLIKERLIGTLYNYWQRVGLGGLLDNSPIYLEIIGLAHKPKSPFKLYATWLKDLDYIRLVSDFLKSHPPDSGQTISKGFSNNLLKLKQLTISWAHNKRKMDDIKL